MYIDFEYDGLYLSDFGFIICDFNGTSGVNVISAGSKITFNTISRNKGKNYSLASTQYDECIQATYQICKNQCVNQNTEITSDEYRDLIRWLNRKEFLTFRAIDNDETREAVYYNASFNVSKITIGGVLYGLELSLETDKPFGYGQEQTISLEITEESQTCIISDLSDEIGYIYPSMTITCASDGDLSIENDMTDCLMLIKNCSVGEIITIDGDTQIISSSLDSHHIYDDFNFEFFKIGNTYTNRDNTITVSKPCTLEIKYRPIIKDTPSC